MANEQYELYQQGTAAALAEAQLALLDGKADSDGYHVMLTAGAADNLTARGDGVTASFLYRTTGGSASVPDDAEATVRSIKGRTLAWNQLVPLFDGDFWTSANVTKVATGNAVTLTSATDGSITKMLRLSDNSHITAGHKFLISAKISTDSGEATAGIYRSNGAMEVGVRAEPSSTDVSLATIGVASEVSYFGMRLNSATPSGEGATFENVQLFDLTQMFGVGNEPSTVEEFEALYPEPYYEYDAGSLLPVKMEGIETVGFNQWDEQWEVGTINSATGQNQAGTTTIRSTGYIPVFPSTQYCCNKGVMLYFYDADKNLISYAANGSALNAVTTPANARYMRFRTGTDYGTTYNNDICINLSWSGYRNGEYEAHWSEQRIISAIAENFPDGMRSAGSVADELTEHEAIRRVGVVDLGTLTWTYTESADFMAAVVSSLGFMASTRNLTTTVPNTSALVTSDAARLRIYGTGYTDAAAFKAAIQGVLMFYELATPVTTPFQQPINMDYRFADFGTERVMVPEGQMSAPPTMDVVYGLNAPDTLRTLPTEYVSKASDASFTAALGAFLNATITRTWNETAGRYDYTITANGGE